MAIENNLAEFISGVSYENIGKDVKHEVKRRFIDALGVAYSSIDSPPASKVKKMIGLYPGNAKIIGMGTSSPDFSAFLNSLFIRYMDPSTAAMAWYSTGNFFTYVRIIPSTILPSSFEKSISGATMFLNPIFPDSGSDGAVKP